MCLRQSEAGWHTVFVITSIVYLLGATFYAMAASGELQTWAKKSPLHGGESVGFESDSEEAAVLLLPTDSH